MAPHARVGKISSSSRTLRKLPRRASYQVAQVAQLLSTDFVPLAPAAFVARRRRRWNWCSIKAVMTMVEYQPPARYAVMADVSNIRVTYAYDFVPDGNGTRVSLRCQVEGRGLKRALGPLVAKVLRSKDGDQLKRIRQALEAE